MFENNKKWAKKLKRKDTDFFSKLSKQQHPQYLWIGCADSRVPANEIVGLMPGELFVHRNIANMVIHTDLNCLSVAQYAIDVLKVKHIIICGHYGCGGISAALTNTATGLSANWIRHIQDIVEKYKSNLKKETDIKQKSNIMCELNIVEQVYNLARNSVVKDAWDKQKLTIHGWIYDIEDGLLNDLYCNIPDISILEKKHSAVIEKIFKKYNID
jgi:carbonic anhydrase